MATKQMRLVLLEQRMTWAEAAIREMKAFLEEGEARPPVSPSPGPTPMVPFWECERCDQLMKWEEGPPEDYPAWETWAELRAFLREAEAVHTGHQSPQPASD